MAAINTRKQFDSDICIDGKRISAMRAIAQATFEESFLTIEIKMPERIFIIRIDDKIEFNKLNTFREKYKLCKVIVYKEIDFNILKSKPYFSA